MRVIAVSTLRKFWERHPAAEQSVKTWVARTCEASWRNPADLKIQYRTASILAGNRVVFNIGGNNYRLVTAISYTAQIVYVKFIGTHAEYDGIDATTVDHTANRRR